MLNALTHHHCHYSYYLNTAVICLYLNPYLQLVVIIIFIIKVKVIVVLVVEVAITAAAASTTTAALLVDLGHDGVRDAFERASDADRFGKMLHAEGGFDLGTPKRWDVKRLSDFCFMGEFEVSLVPQGTLTSPELKGEATDECVITDAGSSCFTIDGLDPPPIDEERHRKSPGIQNNFYDTSTDEFKRPYGTPGAPSGSSGMSLPGFGAESPMPGREKEYEAYKAGQPVGADGGADAAQLERPDGLDPPPIDEERRRKSPGVACNFWDLSTDDFKRPWGTTSGGTTSGGTPAGPVSPASASPAPAAARDESSGLPARVALLESSNERLKLTLSEVIEREEAAKREAEHAKAREEALSRRLEALEARQSDQDAI